MLARGGRRGPPAPSSVSIDPPERLQPRRGRGPGRLLVGGAVHRRRDAASPGRASRSTTSTSTRAAPACSTCSSGWARRVGVLDAPQASARRAGRRRRGARAPSWSRRRSARPRCRCSSTSCRSSRCSPRTRAARAGSRAPRSCAHKESDRIEAVVDALRAIGVRAHGRDRTASRHAASRPGRAAARSTRAATTASRCSAPLQGSSRARASESQGAECVGSIASPASSTSSSPSRRR